MSLSQHECLTTLFSVAMRCEEVRWFYNNEFNNRHQPTTDTNRQHSIYHCKVKLQKQRDMNTKSGIAIKIYILVDRCCKKKASSKKNVFH